MNILAIDLGGTSAKCAVFNEQKEILQEFSIKTDVQNILNNLKKHIDSQLEKSEISWSEIKAIGFACAGFIDTEKGIIKLASNLNWKDFDFKTEAFALFQKPIYLLNDANAAAFGEYWKRNSQGTIDSMVLYTLGTGIGGGIIINGNVVTGNAGFAGEFGHGGNFQTKYECNCGIKNCIEAVSSATGITKLINEFADQNQKSYLWKTKQLNKGLTIVHLSNLILKHNNADALKLLQTGLEPLVNHMSTIMYAFNPQLIILAGGVTNMGNRLLEIVVDILKTKVVEFLLDTTIIDISVLQSKAGLYGSAYFAFEQLKKENN